MKKYLLYIVLYNISIAADAQNLVPNWSFEDTVSCPIGGGQVNLATGWSSYRSSPDYCHSCSNSFNSVPNNQWGYQYPKSGEAYIGLITYITFFSNSREYIGTDLLQSLIPGTKYFISFYSNMAFNPSANFTGVASNKLGLKFSTISYTAFSNPAPVDNFAHIYTDSINADTLNWTKISGSFTADSAYSFIIIGNFFTDSLTSVLILDSTVKYSYYYIDDIRISTDSLFVNSIIPYSSPEIISIFPNPARDWITIWGSDFQSLRIFDVLGKEVYFNNNPFTSPYEINIQNLTSGTYILVAENKNIVSRKKFLILKQ